jgi:DNA-binding NtrC family response regulator
MGRILLVDDEPNMRRILASNLRLDHHQTWEAGGVEEAQRILAANDFDVVITDQKMPDGEGLTVLAAAQEIDPTLPVILLTAVASIELAVESMRQGAFDFLTKPFQPEVVRATVGRACERTRLLRENILLKDAVVRLEGTSEIYGDSPAVRQVRDRIARVAPTHATVLITGETGTGKELVARAIHRNSPRATKPFVAVNCAAFTETLLESELFGHEKGAFTGALTPRIGRFELANTGTLFLDEIGDLPLALQPKLLRVLQEQEFERLGSSRTLRTDVRLVAATNRDLLAMVHQHMFREDLYYRVHVFPLTVPPLRERVDDIPVLVAYLIERYATKAGKKIRHIEQQTLAWLQAYPWPGNIRELQNVVERAVILCDGETFSVDETWVPPAASRASQALRMPVSGRLRVDKQQERDLIEAALAASRGRVSGPAGAARTLGIPRQTLESKIRRLGITTQRFPSAETAAGTPPLGLA